MKRGEFLVKGVLLVCSGACLLESCSSGDDGTTNPPDNGGGNGSNKVSVSLSSLSNVGDQIRKSGVLFFRIEEGDSTSAFIATEAVCPHQGGQLVWKNADGYIECQLHFSRYEPDGDVIRGPQNTTGNTRDLKVYSITIANGMLTATKS